MATLANTELGNTFDKWRLNTNVTTDRVKNITHSTDNGRIVLTGNVEVNTSDFVVDTTTSRVGIGVAAPTKELDVSGEVKISANVAVKTSVLYVDTVNDRVGVATATPTEKLDVIGTIKGTTITDGTTTLSGGTITGTTITDGTATLSGGTITGTTITDGTTTLSGGSFTGTGTLGSGITPYVATSVSASNFKVPFVNHTGTSSGNYALLQDSTSTFTYNPSTNTLTSGNFSGNFSGDGSSITSLNGSQITTGTVGEAYIDSAITRNSDFTVTLNIKNSAGTTQKTLKSIP